MQKAAYRTFYRQQRSERSPERYRQAAAALCQQMEEFLADTSPVIAAYYPLPGEIDTRPAMHQLLKQGIIVALPVVQQTRRLTFHAWDGQDSTLEDGRYGTRHPVHRSTRLVPDIALVPGLSFTRDGWRLGYGGGYYDATLHHHPAIRAWGVVMAEDVAETLPHNRHDCRVERVLVV